MERRWSTVACASTMVSLKSSTGTTKNYSYRVLYTFNSILSMQLSQLEDPRWKSCDLSSVAQVCLQHLWRHWWCRPHPQVGFSLVYVILSCWTGIVPWTRMVPSAMGRVCLSSRPGEMLLAIFPPAGWILSKCVWPKIYMLQDALPPSSILL